MLVKILIKRRFKEGKSKEVCELLNKLRSSAMNLEGYVSGVTLVGYEDPQSMLVISTWQNMEYWLKWKESPQRKQEDALLEIYQDGPTQYEDYILPSFKK